MVNRSYTDGDWQGVIKVVQLWSDHGEPDVASTLLFVQALRRVKLLDKAWSRLQALVDETPRAETLKLAYDIAMERGWTDKGRRCAERLIQIDPNEPEYQILLQATESPATIPDEDTDLSDPVIACHVAEQEMVRGKLVRARVILERIRRDPRIGDRAADLLWALNGEFDMTMEELHTLVGHHARSNLGHLLDLPDDAEHTESVSVEQLADLDAPSSEATAFAGLFRGLEPPTEAVPSAFEDEEVTAVSHMDAVGPDLQHATGQAEDTQIMRVVNRAGPAETEDKTTSFKLSAIDLPLDLDDDLDLGAEGEDEDVIVHVRKHSSTGSTPTRPTKRITLNPSIERQAAGKLDEAAAWAKAPTPAPAPKREIVEDPPEAVPQLSPAEPSPAEDPKRLNVQPAAVWIGVLVILGITGSILILLIGLMSVLQ